MKVLLAVDGSTYTKRMLAYLAAHDDLLGKRCDYTVLTVVPIIPPLAAQYISPPEINSYVKDEADAVFAPIKAFLAQQGWTAGYQHESGHPATTISTVASEGKFDLLVMGSHGHTVLGSLMLGSVATSVLSQCKTPLLLIR